MGTEGDSCPFCGHWLRFHHDNRCYAGTGLVDVAGVAVACSCGKKEELGRVTPSVKR